jgi:hypothetical protein
MKAWMRNKWLRIPLLTAGAFAIGVVLLLGVNAIDESLSPEAKALLAAAPPPAPSERNGYVHLLGLGAPEGETPYAAGLKVVEVLRKQEEPGFQWSRDWDREVSAGVAKVEKSITNACSISAKSCLENIAGKAELRPVVVKHAPLMARYREVRAMPEYAEIYHPASFLSMTPPLQSGVYQLTLATAAAHVQSGNLEAALRELDQENAFHRKVAVNAAMVVTKMVSLTYLQMQALFVSDLVRTRPAVASKHLARLQALVRPLTAEEADMSKVLRTDASYQARMLRRDEIARIVRMDGSGAGWMVPLFYREGETINVYAAQNALRRKVAEVPAAQYGSATEEAKRAAAALVPDGVLRPLINPVGLTQLEELADYDVISVVGRMHDAQGILALVATQLALQAAGARTPEAIGKALAGPAGTARPDPYTGKPMVYRAENNSLGFESPSKGGGLVMHVKKRMGGRLAVTL